MKLIPKQINLIGLVMMAWLSLIKTIYSQSIQFQYGSNGILVNKHIDIDKKDFVIIGYDIVCKGKAAEYSVSTNEKATWSNGVTGIKTSYTITKDTIIIAVITNKYGCAYEQAISVKAANLPVKPIIERFGDSLIVRNVTGQFEWFRNGQLFNVGLNLIRTSLEGIYSVKIIDGNGCESISEGFNFIISSTKEIATNIFELYPNPAKDKVYIKSNKNLVEYSSMKMFSIDGKEISFSYYDGYFDTSQLASGYYVVLISSSKDTVSLPFIKID